MKKFLTSLIIGSTCLAIGITLLFFEIQNFDIVYGCEAYDEEYYNVTKTFDVASQDLKIIFKEEDIEYHIVYDETMKEEVKVEFTNGIDEIVRDNQLVLDTNYDGYRRDKVHYNILRILNKFVDGLKEGKIYECNEYRSVRITMAKTSKEKIEFLYE